jgi:hypothetical protein
MVGKQARTIVSTILGAALAVGTVPVHQPAAVHASESPWTVLAVDPDPTDWISGGHAVTLSPPVTPFVTGASSAGYFAIGAGTYPESWGLGVSAPLGTDITPGTTYPVGPYATQTRAGLSFNHASNGCTPSGSITVEDFTVDPSTATLLTLAATFSLNCTFGTNPTIYGEVRFNSSVPWASASVTPAAVDFGVDPWGGPSIARSVTLTSTGSGPVSIGSIGIDGVNADDFTLGAGTCLPGDLAPGDSCTVEVLYNAHAFVWQRAAQLQIVVSIARGGLVVPLTGTDALPWSGDPSQVDFGWVGQLASRSATVTVGYEGDGSMDVASVGIVPVGDSYRADFKVTADTCSGTSVPTGGSCSITVTFAPNEEGENLASVVLNGPSPIPVTGAWVASLHAWGGAYEMPAFFKTHVVASPAYSWNHGRALARTQTTGGGQVLHLVSMTNRVSGKWVTNSGPHMAVNYQRSGSGATWSAAKRLNATSAHGYWASLAASGSTVAAAWVQSAKVYGVTATAPRVVWFRRNTNHGLAAAWKPAVRLSSSTGRADSPSVAISGSRVLVAWTDGSTGAIKVARSTDGGASFRTASVATTARSTSLGKMGMPKVAISGNLAIIAWFANGSNAIRARISTTGGWRWGTTTLIAGSSTSVPSVAVAPGRAAIAFTGETNGSSQGLLVRLWKGSWEGGVRSPAPWATGQPQYRPAVFLRGSTEIAVASSACMDVCDDYDVDTLVDLWWFESPDNGVHWAWTAPAQSQETDDTKISDVPSVWWGPTRIVAWNAWAMGSSYSRIHVATSEDFPTPAASGMTAAPLVPAPGPAAGAPPLCPVRDDRPTSIPLFGESC